MKFPGAGRNIGHKAHGRVRGGRGGVARHWVETRGDEIVIQIAAHVVSVGSAQTLVGLSVTRVKQG